MQTIHEKILSVREHKLRQVAFSALASITILGCIFLVRAIDWEIYSRVISLTISIALGISALATLKLGYSRTIAAFLGIAGCTIGMSYASYSSGGLSNEASIWLFIMPVVGAIIGGRPGCVYGIIFSTISVVLLFTAEYLYGTPPNLTPIEAQASQNRLHQFGALVVISISIWTLLKQVGFAEGQLTDLVFDLSKEVKARHLAEQEAERASKIKSEFLANMSHEIRTPMNGITGVLNILKDQELNVEQNRYLKLALSSSNTLMVIINDILDLSKIESGKLEIESIDFDIRALIEEATELHQVKTAEKGIDFVKEIELDAEWVKSDPIRLRQVIDNLLSNAIKFTETGSVTFKASIKPSDSGSFDLDCQVIDTGIGLNDEQRDRLFRPFTQMESSTTRRFGGTGLGLTIVKNIIELMAGELNVESNLGEGSIFRFRLPLGSASSKPKEITTEKYEETNQQAAQVLLVEDNDINIEVAKAILGKFNTEICVAKNGREGIEKVTSKEFDIVFMDCQMPIMDGYETTKAIRQIESLKNLPIVAMTANAMKGDKEKCLDAGMNDYLSKPIVPEAVSQILERWAR